MPSAEPSGTALLMVGLGTLFVLAAAFSRPFGRVGIPAVFLFLVLGILAGSEGLGGIEFEDYRLTFRIGSVALALILFDGGLNTPLARVRAVAAPAGLLATVGVVATAAVTALLGRVLGLAWSEALLLGAIVSSTDAAAVFSVLRSGGVNLNARLASTLEVESGLNDPVAVIMTLSLTAAALNGGLPGAAVLITLVVQLAVGTAVGIAIGLAARWTIGRLELLGAGLYAVLTVAIALIAFGLPTLLGGSGFLAVYLTGLVLGNGPMPYAHALRRVHDFVAWLSQIVMFMAMGLLVSPSRLLGVMWPGVGVALLLALIARPAVVTALLLPFRYPTREIVFASWVGLKGAVPIVLATFPVLAGAPGASRVFDLVFFVVAVSAVVQGGSVRWLASRLQLDVRAPEQPLAILEINSRKPLAGEIVSFYIEPPLAVCGVTIAELPWPPAAAAMLVVRGDELVAPKGDVCLQAGDHVYVFCRPQDRAFITLLFGTEELRDTTP